MAELFELGSIVATPAALHRLQELEYNPLYYLHRHVSGDFGDLGDFDREENQRAAAAGDRVFSSYHLTGPDDKLWVITEWDRSATTLLLPGDY